MAPTAVVVQVPTRRSKADLTTYRRAGSAVAAVLARGGTIERASIDEAYLDLTERAKRTLRETAWEEVLATARTSHAAGARKPGEDGEDRGAFVSKASLRAGSADAPVVVGTTSANAESAKEEEDPMRNFRPKTAGRGVRCVVESPGTRVARRGEASRSRSVHLFQSAQGVRG